MFSNKIFYSITFQLLLLNIEYYCYPPILYMNAWGAFNIYVIIRKYITSCSVDITCYKSIPSTIRYFFF